MPEGYISAKSARGMVPWSRALELLDGAPGYWLATTDVDGAPHLVQQGAPGSRTDSSSRAAQTRAGRGTSRAMPARR
jgi:hypothetical protein